mmetsp:Transcript_2214/g.4859  ORF Transcript_2214/g.4859 Transcript_2214/m.4859 type:complete len:87 (+) Transcript_2214:2369-2629(+)
MKTAEPTNEAKVRVARDVVTPAAVPAKDADAHKIQRTKSQIFPKLKISVSFVPSVRKNVQKDPRKIIDKLIKIGPLHNTNPLAQSS